MFYRGGVGVGTAEMALTSASDPEASEGSDTVAPEAFEGCVGPFAL